MLPDLRHTVSQFLHEQHLNGSTLIVAVSGGVDSVVLLHLLCALRSTHQLHLHVAHVHHGLRGAEADRDAAFVQALAKQWNAAASILNVDVPAALEHATDGVEATARRLRYQALAELAETLQVRAVVTAHTADDVAETMIMHLARGSGIDGLSAHRAKRALGASVLVRPLLSTLRSEILDYAHRHDLTWCDDTTNNELHARRNQVRHLVMPHMRTVFGADVARRIARSSTLAFNARRIVHESVQELAQATISHHDGVTTIALEQLGDRSDAMILEVLRRALHEHTAVSASYIDTMRLQALLTAEPGSMASLQHQIMAVRDRKHLILMQGQPPAPPPAVGIPHDGAYVAGSERLLVRTADRQHTVIDPDPSVLQMDAQVVQGTLQWRPWMHGDRFIPFGMQGSVLVSDLLNDAKVPTGVRSRVRVVADHGGILWVCGLRAAERTRITSRTDRVITITTELLHQS